MLELGEMLGVVIVGAVLSTKTVTEALTEEPSESVAVAEQDIDDPTLVLLAVTVKVFPLSTLEEPIDHS